MTIRAIMMGAYILREQKASSVVLTEWQQLKQLQRLKQQAAV